MDAARRTTAMWTMAVDAVTAEVTTALTRAGVESLLLKGPAIASWLYEDPSLRPYRDSDLLVAPADVSAAEAVLEGLGFTREFGPLPHSGMESPPSSPWRRDAAMVDLHEALPGVDADRGRAWEVLLAGSDDQVVGGTTARVLGPAARLTHVALHAAHHGRHYESPLRDLRRALELVQVDDWRDAAALAERIGAAAAFGAGLQLLPEGRAVAGRLGLRPPGRAAWLLMSGEVPLAGGVARLHAARGAAATAKLLRDELFPSAEFMRWWAPFARRGRRALALAYLWRGAYLIGHAPVALRAWLRARDAAPRA